MNKPQDLFHLLIVKTRGAMPLLPCDQHLCMYASGWGCVTNHVLFDHVIVKKTCAYWYTVNFFLLKLLFIHSEFYSGVRTMLILCYLTNIGNLELLRFAVSHFCTVISWFYFVKYLYFACANKKVKLKYNCVANA